MRQFITCSTISKSVLTFALFLSSIAIVRAQQTSISDYVIFGGNSVQFGSSVTINNGSIGSNKLVQSTGNTSVTSNIYSGGTISLTNSNVVKGKIAAGILNTATFPNTATILSVGSSATLTKSIDVNGNIVIGGGTITGPVNHPLNTTYYLSNSLVPNDNPGVTLPVLPSMPGVTPFLQNNSVTDITGTTTILASTDGTAVIRRDILLGGNKTITLKGAGVYLFRSIKNTGNSNNFVFDLSATPTGKIKVYVEGNVDLGKVSASVVGGTESQIYFETHGTGTTAWATANGSGGGSKWVGSIWAPYGDINIGSGTGTTSITGALWSGKQVILQSGITLNYAPFIFCNPPAITTQPVAPAAICSGTIGTQTLTVTATGTGLTYSWRKAGVAVTNGGAISGQGTPTLILTNPTASDAGNYDVVVGGTCGTTTSNVVAVTVNDLPTISGNLNVCVGSTTTLAGSGIAAALTPWVSSNPLVATISSAGVVTTVGTVGGTSVITYTNNNGCTVTATVTVNALPAIVDAGGPDKPYNFDGITTVGNPNLTGFNFKWTAPPGGLIKGSDNGATIIVEAPGIYKLTVTNAGCSSSDEVLVSNKVKTVIGSELTSIYYNNPTGLPSPFFIMKDGYVRIDIIVNIGYIGTTSYYDYLLTLLPQTTPAYLIDYGLINIVTNGENGLGKKEIIITGDFPIANLLKLNALSTYINYCRPFYQAFSNIGLTTSAGDTTMRSNLVRSGYKIAGDGINVGIISNSFATITAGTTTPLKTNTYAQDLLNKDLSDVTILQDYPKSTDEGRAMAQIVHDVAPGAKLYFRTGYFTAGDFATGIKQLADAGCNVIVDDLTYFTEPFLKDGVIAKAVDAVKALGVTYFSSAGNFANKSYEKDFAPVDAAQAGFAGLKAHNFSNTAGAVDIFQHVKLPPGDYTIVLQWVDDIYSNGETSGTQYDLDMYWRSNSGGGTNLKGFNRDNTNGDPLEIMPFTIKTSDGITDADFLIVNNTTGGNPARIKYVIYRGDVEFLEYNEGGSSTIVGQANAAGAIAVGASRFDKAPPYLTTPLIESFSSVGGTKIGDVVRYKPDIVGPDGVNTTVNMGQDYSNVDTKVVADGYSNFFGTSAAAPHAAAVAALIMQGKKKFLNQDVSVSTPDQIRDLLQLTAVDMNTASNLSATNKFDFISGYGLVDADAAMRTFAAPTATLINVEVPTNIKPCSGVVPFTVTITGENFSPNTVVYLINGPGDSVIYAPTFIYPDSVVVTITNSCIGNPEIKAYTPPKTIRGDGGFSNGKYFYSAYVTVEAVSINKKYGETLVALDTVIRVNGKLLQDTAAQNPALTLASIGLAAMTVTTPATSISDVGTYAINVTRIFDPNIAADVEFQRKYNYKFTDGTVTIAKMPLRITPDNKTITYGQNIGKITFQYFFDRTNIADATGMETIIRNYHEAFLPTNALAVIKDFKQPQINGSILDTTKLRNLNMVASFNAVNNSRKFTLLSNNTLVPITDAATLLKDSLNVQYLVDIASESIYNYSVDPSTAKFFPAYPGINSRALLSAASLSSDDINKGLVTIPNTTSTTVKVINGTLAQTVSSTTGPIVPIVGGNLVQITDAELTNPASDDLAEYIKGAWYKISSDATGHVSLTKILNQILRGANGVIINVENGISTVQIPGGGTSPILTNATILRGANGVPDILVTGSNVPVPDGSLIEMENGDLVQFNKGAFSLSALSNGVILRGANGIILRGANGVILRGPNGVILRGANGVILRGANGVILRGANGVILRGANALALGADAATNNTGVILDSDDAYNDGTGYAWLGSMFGVNMITGLDAGKQYLVPGVLVDPNFDISYGLGEVNITANCLKTHSDVSNFGSTANPGTPTSLWFSMTTKVSGQLKKKGDFILFKAGDITFTNITSDPTVTNFPLPTGKIVATDTVTAPVTSYNAETNTWTTKVPLRFSSTSDIFITGAIINSSNGYVKNNGARHVVKGAFYSNVTFSDQWTYQMAAYQLPSAYIMYSDVAAPGKVVSINGTYKAGTPPVSLLTYLVNGASGGGGNNYTGSSGGFDNFTACPSDPLNPYTSSRGLTGIPLLDGVRPIAQEGLFSKEKMDVYPNPATNNVMLSFVPANRGISKMTLLTVDGKRVMEVNYGVSEAGKNYVKNIDVSKLVGGVYMIQLNTGDKTTIKKIIINR